MPCPRCKNPQYPDQFKAVNGPTGSEPVKCCTECDYPTLKPEVRQRIGLKLMAVGHLLPLGAKRELVKGIQPKYFGETLDKHRRPEDELKALKTEWEKERYDVGNFFDWIEDKTPKATVLQLDANNRKEYQVTIKEKQLVGKHVSGKANEHAFVLSEEGIFYSSPKDTKSELRIHHSSFLSGAPVKCAGVFFCNGALNGYSRNIFYVKDYSGHYTPGIAEILRLKEALIELNEDIDFWYVNGGSTPLWKGPISKFDVKNTEIAKIIEAIEAKKLQTRV